LLPRRILEERLRRFLEEDVGQGDLTTMLTVPPGAMAEAEVLVKEDGVIAGLEEALALLESSGLRATALTTDGANVKGKTAVIRVSGPAGTLLSLERTLLNLLARMSGVATATRRLVERVRSSGYETRIACTRKVAPGLLYFDKRAVMLGGGDTHRLHLDDMVLIKDNHLAVIGDVKRALKRVRDAVSFSKKVEVEVSTVGEALEAAEAGADIIMLDNFTPEQVREALEALERKGLRRKVLVEASGGITEQNILEFAATGADILSLGELTDSVKALDVSLDVVRVRKP